MCRLWGKFQISFDFIYVHCAFLTSFTTYAFSFWPNKLLTSPAVQKDQDTYIVLRHDNNIKYTWAVYLKSTYHALGISNFKIKSKLDHELTCWKRVPCQSVA